MSIKQVKVFVDDLATGMYVSALDKPWTDTPFPLQGFLLNGDDEVAKVKRYCEYVYIDVTKGREPLDKSFKVSSNLTASRESEPVESTATTLRIPLEKIKYQKSVELASEMPMAKRVVNNMIGCLTLATRQLARGSEVQIEQLEKSVDEMVDSVIRCPDAFTWLVRLRAKDSASHDHSVRCALWAVQLGRHLGLEKQQLSDLGMSCLLKDVGKIKLPRALLHRVDRTIEEEAEYRDFVRHSVELLQQGGYQNRSVLTLIKFHCECYDGSGFPKGLSGNKIPFLASVIGIATAYDQLSNPVGSMVPLSPSQATNKLYSLRGKLFAPELVVEFIKSVGLYPPGTVVELSTGHIGVITEQDANARLSPRVAVFKSTDAYSMESVFTTIDLKDQSSSRRRIKEIGGKPADDQKIAITRDLDSNNYDIDNELLALLISRNYSEAKHQLSLGGQPSPARNSAKGMFAGLMNRFAR